MFFFNFLFFLNLIFTFFTLDVISLFEHCNHKVVLKTGEKLYVNSPHYPATYPVGSSCRYLLKAPPDHQLKFSCSIKFNAPNLATSCLNEVFYFNREGSEILTESEYFCGTGKLERKSFLNQASISYISTPNYKRTFTNVKEKLQNKETKEKATEIEKEKQHEIITTTTKHTPTTSKALKVNQLTTTTKSIAVLSNNLLTTTTFSPALTSTTSLPATTAPLVEKENINKEKKVNNSFAYVLAFLSNNIDSKGKVVAATTATTKLPKLTATKKVKNFSTTSVLNCSNFLTANNTCHNGSIGTTHKISTKRVAKVIVGQKQDYANAQQSTNILSNFDFTTNHFIQNTRLLEADGGSFSCLVEVFEPQCECGWGSTVKIVGASGVAGINEFPSMAGLMTIKNQKIFCGATIIHHRYLLSAAHCFLTTETSRADYLTAVVGEHDLSTVLDSLYTRQYDLIKIILHEHFKSSSNKVHHDIALLKTRFSIEWNRSVGPVCLPFYGLKYGSVAVPYKGQRVEAAGWGTTAFGGQQSTLLLKTTLDVIAHAECQILIGNLPLGEFCTYTPGLDTCQYDSGGALYARGERLYAVGIVSYGYACATTLPSVNTRISAYLKWILSKTPEVKYCIK